MNRCPSLDALLDQEADASHVEHCPLCQEKLRRAYDLRAAIRAAPLPRLGEDDADRLEASLLSAARCTPQTSSQTQRRYVHLAAAAGLVAAVVIGGAVVGPRFNTSQALVSRERTASRAEVSRPATATPGSPGPSSNARAQRRGTVFADGARYIHTVEPIPNGQFERVTFDEGQIFLVVDKLGPRDRFVVEVGPDQVEVRGTKFSVQARAGRIFSVHVTEGSVVLRKADREEQWLRRNETWSALPSHRASQGPPQPALSADESASSSSARAPQGQARSSARDRQSQARGAQDLNPPSPRSPSVTGDPAFARAPRGQRPDNEPRLSRPASEARTESTAPREYTEREDRAVGSLLQNIDDAEKAFVRGWRALQTDQHDIAVQNLTRAAALDGPHREDAAYWSAVALAKAGRASKATEVFARFIAEFPNSTWSSGARAMLGWLYFDAGNAAEARRLFEAAKTSSDADVRRSAERGLAALE